MKIQTGNAVRGDDYFNRKNLINQAWDLLEAGSHILIAAPRRVGKTSLMYYLQDNPQEHYCFLYMITESVNNENEFYRRMVNKVLKTNFLKNSKKIIAFLEKHQPKIKKVGLDGIEFGVGDKLDYREMLIKILKSPGAEYQKLIIMVDEFPETLENIIEDEGEGAGKHFLQSNRELRQNLEISKNVQFIYTGSIGLENIVSKLNIVKTIIDLSRLKIPPLKLTEAKQLIILLLENVEFDISDSIMEYILKKVEWLIPFYIQLLIDELRNLHRDTHLDKISEDTVNQAIAEMLEQRQHFEHWHTRLRSSMKKSEYNFAKELLNILSENETIDSNELFNLAVKHGLEETYKDVVGSLIYDGYINNHDDIKVYRYNSPILRMWWRQNVAN
ncbi:MAG: ATP-binding protein [bacterium]